MHSYLHPHSHSSHVQGGVLAYGMNKSEAISALKKQTGTSMEKKKLSVLPKKEKKVHNLNINNINININFLKEKELGILRVSSIKNFPIEQGLIDGGIGGILEENKKSAKESKKDTAKSSKKDTAKDTRISPTIHTNQKSIFFANQKSQKVFLGQENRNAASEASRNYSPRKTQKTSAQVITTRMP